MIKDELEKRKLPKLLKFNDGSTVKNKEYIKKVNK